jgi:hypothetical protein
VHHWFKRSTRGKKTAIRDNDDDDDKGRGKGKVVPVLFFNEDYAMKVCWGSGGIAPHIL